MKALIASILSLLGQAEVIESKTFGPNQAMPQVPFEVYYVEYDKMVHVVGSCDHTRIDSVTLIFSDSNDNISSMVYATINKAFNQPGITRVQICRKEIK